MVFRAQVCILFLYIYNILSPIREPFDCYWTRRETINSHVIAGHNIYNFFSSLPVNATHVYYIYCIIYIIIKYMQHYFYKKKTGYTCTL